MSLSVATNSVPGDLGSKLAAIASAGFSGIELFEPDFTRFDRGPRDVAHLAADHGLDIRLLQPFHDFEGLKGHLRSRAFDRLERKFDLMQELGGNLLLLCSSTHTEAATGLDDIAVDLDDLAVRAADRGVRVAYLALPWGRSIRTENQALEAIERIDKPSLGLALNSALTLEDGSKPARLRDLPGARVFHVQLADAPKSRFGSGGTFAKSSLLPGQGALNLAGFVRVVAKSGYSGAWSVGTIDDIHAQGETKAAATDAYRALVNVLDEVSRTEPALHFNIPDLPERVHATGFEFIEFAAGEGDGQAFTSMLSSLCFRMERRHITKSVELWRQGAVNIVVNTDSEGFAHAAYLSHGPSVCDMGLRVKDAETTVARASSLGAPVFSQPVGTGELDIPAIRGVGGNVVHFIDEKSDLHRVWDIEFDPVAKTVTTEPAGIRRIDHVAQTMNDEEMQSWLLYYTSTFEMEKSAVVDVADPSGVVHSQVVESPEGEVRLNLNGAGSGRTFAGAFLADRFGAGVQHIAFLTDDIFETSSRLEEAGFPRLAISRNYYPDLQAIFGLDDSFVESLAAANILYDRTGKSEFFQIYSQPIFDGFFFEIVQRCNGYQEYGARNAKFRLAAQLNHRRMADAAAQ
ncbi:MAG: TIM barrel protein [Pseudomonadota bacterium]